VTFIL